MISFNAAYSQTLKHIHPLESVSVEIGSATDRVVAEMLHALVNSPSVDVSLKDGYALHSADIAHATEQAPICLRLLGVIPAGGRWEGVVSRGEALRILTGAPIPRGATAVLSEEFALEEDGRVIASNHAKPGQNIMRQGSDVKLGQHIVGAGDVLRPTSVGLLAAAGYSQIQVIRRPRIAILATGDEVLAPGMQLEEGKLYASNLVTIASWCLRDGMEVCTRVVPDQELQVRQALMDGLRDYDAVLTSGGAWHGERDLVVRVLDGMGWEKVYRHVRMGPGKAIGFGKHADKPIFCLPGGPPSNHMAFLQLALPGLQKLGGHRELGLPTVHATLTETLHGQMDWTQFIHGRLSREGAAIAFTPIKMMSRLVSMAYADAIATIPEGVGQIHEGSPTQVQLLT
jgi:molybdopterin molybdotransferase